MALDDFERAPEYQALASRAARDGRFSNAHVLRALSRSVNQAVLEGEPLLSLSFDSRRSSNPEVDEKAIRAVATPFWTRLLPGIHRCTKMPGLTRADFFIHAEITAGARVFLQIETLNSVLDISSDHPSGRVFELIGTGNEERYTLEDVPIANGDMERIGFWIRGERTDNEGDTTSHGVPSLSVNRALVEKVTSDGYLFPRQSTTWNVLLTEDRWAVDHVVVIDTSTNPMLPTGTEIFSAQIIDVEQRDTQSAQLQALKLFRPPASEQEAASLSGRAFTIYELPKIRLFAIDAYTQDSDGTGMRPTRKIHYHPRAPHVGFVYGNALRNAQDIQKYRGRMLIQKSWPRNLERPFIIDGFITASELIVGTDYETFFVWHNELREAPGVDAAIPRSKIVAHICFTVFSTLARFARFRMEVDDGSQQAASTTEVVLSSDSTARIPEGSLSPFESRSGSYEAQIVISQFFGEAFRKHTVQAYATHDSPSSVPQADAMRIDSIDLWMEQF